MARRSSRIRIPDPGALSSLIGRIYDAPHLHDGWVSVIAEIAQYMGARSAELLSHVQDAHVAPIAATHNLDPFYWRLYGEHYWKEDSWARAGHAKGLYRSGLIRT